MNTLDKSKCCNAEVGIDYKNYFDTDNGLACVECGQRCKVKSYTSSMQNLKTIGNAISSAVAYLLAMCLGVFLLLGTLAVLMATVSGIISFLGF